MQTQSPAPSPSVFKPAMSFRTATLAESLVRKREGLLASTRTYEAQSGILDPSSTAETDRLIRLIVVVAEDICK